MNFRPTLKEVWSEGFDIWDKGLVYLWVFSITLNLAAGAWLVAACGALIVFYLYLYKESNLRAKVYQQLVEADIRSMGFEPGTSTIRLNPDE